MIDEQLLDRAQTIGKRFARLLDDLGGLKGLVDQGLVRGEPGERRLLLGVVGVDRLEKVLAKLFDEDEFLSPYGLRALSAFHREHPYELDVEGVRATHRLRAGRIDHVDVRRQLQLAGADLVPAQLPAHQRPRSLRPVLRRRPPVRVPDRAAAPRARWSEIAADLRAAPRSRCSSPDPTGAGRASAASSACSTTPAWKDNLVFNEYFHGDNGAGLGASHQTGWTGVIADLIRGRPGDGVYSVGDHPASAIRARSRN